MKKILLLAGGVLALSACTDGGTCDSGDCESAADSGETGVDCPTYTGTTYIGFDDGLCDIPLDDDGVAYSSYASAIGYDCDSSSWWYDIFTVGWTGGADLYIYQTRDTPPWDETHSIGSYDYGDGGHWDNLYAVLDETDDWEAVTDGVTLYDCDEERESGLTWHVIVYEADEQTQADCAVWGHDTAVLGTGCTDWS